MQRRLRQAAEAIDQALVICSRAGYSGETTSKNVAEIHSELRKAAQSLERVANLPLFEEAAEEPQLDERQMTFKERRLARQKLREQKAQKRAKRAQKRSRR